MKDITKIIYYIILLLILIFTLIQLNNYKNISKALKIIENTTSDLSAIKDSIAKTRIIVEDILNRIEKDENELKILKAQREILDYEIKLKQAKTIEEINYYKNEIKKTLAIKDSLIKIAKKFEP